MGLRNRLIYFSTWLANRRFLTATLHPQDAENKLWQRCLQLYQKGEFWQTFAPDALGKGKLQNFPITDYEDYREAIEQSKSSGVVPMTGERALFFADSSGTSASPKQFPLTDSFRRDFQKTQPPMVHRLTRDYPKFLDTPALYLAATNSNKKAPCGLEIGYISNFNYRNMPSYIAKLYGIPREVLRDDVTFNQWAPIYAAAKDISGIFGITPRVVANFIKPIVEKFAQTLECLQNPLLVPEGLPPIQIDPARLSYLQTLQSRSTILIHEVWPSLSFICTWKASVAGMQLPELQKLTGSVPIIDGLYSATEAWFNVPFFEGDLGGPLVQEAVLAEFIPVEQDINAANLLRSWQLQAGQDYEVFVTTSMGMIRYRLKDIVHCSGYINQSPVIYFKYKADNILTLTTIRMGEDQLLNALGFLKVSDPSKIRISNHVDGYRLQVVITDDSADHFSEADFDAAVRKANPYYDEERNSGHIGAPSVARVSTSHPAFAVAKTHAQSKPQLVSKTPIIVTN